MSGFATASVPVDDWAWVTGEPQATAVIKHRPEDFIVEEELGFTPTGAGEHLLLRLRKRNLSTTEVAGRLASTLQLKHIDVGYAGMKDRRATATQWFSVRLTPERERSLVSLEDADLQVLETRRNQRKLKIGCHRGNHFRLHLRQVTGESGQLERKLRWLDASGVPNYFGRQRFGKQLSNVHQMQQLLESQSAEQPGPGRGRRSMLYSAARAWLFNQLLSSRIRQRNWNRYLEGDVLSLDGSKRCFTVAPGQWDQLLQRRLATLDIHPTGPLSGCRNSKDHYTTRAQVADMEEAVLAQYAAVVRGLERQGLQAGRRPLRFRLEGLQWHWPGETELQIRFSLPTGAYATSLLRELCRTDDC